MPGVTFDELRVPANPDDDFRALIALQNLVDADVVGTNDLAMLSEEELPDWHDPYEPRRAIVARAGGRIVGSGIYQYSTEASPELAWFTISVLPEHRRRGIGSALQDRLVRLALSNGRTTLQAYSLAKDRGGGMLPSPTGFGAVSLADDSVQFLIHHGWSLEQVERCSRLALPATLAAEPAAPGYRLHYFADHTPEQWLDDMAMLSTRMSTDAPTAGLDDTEDLWTAARLLDYEAARDSSPRTELFTVAEHLESGRLAGFTGLSVPAERERAVVQEDTIVLREHRGHGLGRSLKLANVRYLEDVAPGHPSITTFNAEENRHMLAVNEAMGFVPRAYEGVWKKTLT